MTLTLDNLTVAATAVSDGLGRAIANRRAELGMTQQDLATAAGIARPTLGKIERGVNIPRPVTMGKLDKALGWAPGTARAHAAGEPAPFDIDGMPVKSSLVLVEPSPGVEVEYVDAYGMRVNAVYRDAVDAAETDRQSLKIYNAKGDVIGGVAAGRWISYSVNYSAA